MRRCGRTPARDPVGLLDERDAQSDRVRDARRRDKILRLHPAARAVTEDERGPRVVCADPRARSRVPNGVSISSVFTEAMLPRRLNPGAAAP